METETDLQANFYSKENNIILSEETYIQNYTDQAPGINIYLRDNEQKRFTFGTFSGTIPLVTRTNSLGEDLIRINSNVNQINTKLNEGNLHDHILLPDYKSNYTFKGVSKKSYTKPRAKQRNKASEQEADESGGKVH